MTSEDECLKHAEFCERRATVAKTSTHRDLFLFTADEWRKLAKDRRALRAEPFMRAKPT
jgi:hypothetical protein